MYDTAGSINIASAYGCDVYANALEKPTVIKYCMMIKSSVCVVYKQGNIFMLWNSNKDTEKLPLVTHV